MAVKLYSKGVDVVATCRNWALFMKVALRLLLLVPANVYADFEGVPKKAFNLFILGLKHFVTGNGLKYT